MTVLDPENNQSQKSGLDWSYRLAKEPERLANATFWAFRKISDRATTSEKELNIPPRPSITQ